MMADSKSKRAYVPPHVQQQMARQLQQSVPKHMQQYVGAFMEQNVVNPQKYGNPTAGMSTTGNNPTGRPVTYRPVTNLPRSAHYQQYRDPSAPPTDLYPTQAQPGASTVVQPQEQYGHQPAPTPPPQPQQPYDFIMNPASPPKSSRFSNSLPMRIGLVTGGLLILLVAFNVIKGLLAGPSPTPYFVSTVQDQQAIIHLLGQAKKQPDLNTANSNFLATAELSLTSSRTDILDYIDKIGKKAEAKQLNLKVSLKLDEQLNTAAAAGTYNPTFKEIMQSKLETYKRDLKTAYLKAPGQNGRALMDKNLKQADLLLKQLNVDSAQ